MSKQIQIRRGTAAEHENFIGALGEITVDTTNKTIRVHDGETVGGIQLARKNEIMNFSAPGTKYIDLTLKESGAYYIAPADGWIYVRKQASASGQFLAIHKIMHDGTSFEAGVAWSTATQALYANIPVYNGETFKITYSANGSAASEFLKFLYTNSIQ